MGKRNYDAVDICKWLCSWLVIYIHCGSVLLDTPALDKLMREGVCRIAVPFFFAASALLLFQKMGDPKNCGKQNRKRIMKFCSSLLVLYTVWSVVYIAYDMFYNNYNHLEQRTVMEYIYRYFIEGSHFHLWYLIASVYAVFVVYGLWRIGRPAVLSVCVLGCVLKYLETPFRWRGLYELPFMYLLTSECFALFRTIFMAIPLMCLGVLCMEDHDKKSSRHWRRGLIWSSVLYVAEMVVIYIIYRESMQTEILLTGPLVAYYLTNWLFTVNFRLPRKWMGKILRISSTWIYCAHVLVMLLYGWIFAYHGIIRFMFVGVVTVISGIPYVAYKMLLDKRKRHESTSKGCEVTI